MRSDPRKLSLSLSLVFSVFIFLLGYYLQFAFFEKPQFLFALIVAVVFGVLFYFVQRAVFEKFIYEKIRVIYKTIRKSKTGKQEQRKLFSSQGDIIETVNRDVALWAATQEKEIADLKRLEVYRRDFLGNVSHELKTPITNIQGYVLTLLDGGLYDPAVNQKYLRRTAKSIKRMISIVNDLEEISKLESGMIQLQHSRFNLANCIYEVFELLEIEAQKMTVKLLYNDNPVIPVFVSADQEKIRQVLINLIDNSLKYGKENGTTTVSSFDMDDHVLVEVTDDGIGIEESELPRVFERFYRTEKSREKSRKGSGLGLAIVKHIIEAHGQTIHVRSKVGVGSTFAFTLKKG
jgi:two-component system, OmpR family, phosphate regulon sensor histidine kinase PhoR